MNKLEIVSGNANVELAEEICQELGKKLGGMMVGRFSEGREPDNREKEKTRKDRHRVCRGGRQDKYRSTGNAG